VIELGREWRERGTDENKSGKEGMIRHLKDQEIVIGMLD
jgi:hypothetical protein